MKDIIFRAACIILTVAFASSSAVHAQTTPTEDSNPDDKSRLPFSILTVGEEPPFRSEIRGEERVQIAPPEGSIPPSRIEVANGAAVSLILGNLCETTSPKGAETIQLNDNGEEWLSCKVPESLRSKPKMLVVWREPTKMWDSPQYLLLDGAPVGFPAGSVRFVNLLPVPVIFNLGKLSTEIKSLDFLIVPGPEKETPLKIAFMNPKKEIVPVFDSVLDPSNPRVRAQVIIYRTDSEASDVPARALTSWQQISAVNPKSPENR